MDEKDEKLIFAAFAMMGLVARGESPISTAEQMWQYAEFAMNYKNYKESQDD